MGSSPRTPLQQHIIEISHWIVISLSLIGTFVFFRSYRKRREKSTSMYMIFVLSIADLLFPIMNIIVLLFLRDEKSAIVALILEIFLYRISLSWSTCLAISTFLILCKELVFNAKKFMFRGFFASFAFGIICPIAAATGAWGVKIVYTGPGACLLRFPNPEESNKLMFYLVFDIFGTLLPVLMISFCYFQIYKKLKEAYKFHLAQSRINPNKILIYAFIPILCFVPLVASDPFFTLRGEIIPFPLQLFITVTRRSWAFLNLLAYWFLNPAFERGNSLNSADNSANLSASDLSNL